MTIERKLKKFKFGIKIINSSIIILRDALNNDCAFYDCANIRDNIELLILKTDEMLEAYKDLSQFIQETEECLQINFLLQNILSLLKILKYSLKAKRSKITYDDIANCVNTISKHTLQAFLYVQNVIPECDNIIDNIVPFFNE